MPGTNRSLIRSGARANDAFWDNAVITGKVAKRRLLEKADVWGGCSCHGVQIAKRQDKGGALDASLYDACSDCKNTTD